VKRPPERVIIFDDVFTTGATLSACAAALKEAGAREVHGL
jgi:predicted amidophosphoribosyltransferase